MAIRLVSATSPYLLQHAHHPVDWWEWGDEAFAEAKRRNVPVLLSVGYAACHWCHVMAHESFEDPATAEQMNDGFVNVKVDREERPDVDAVYMAATQALTGQGGWPMTVFLTPQGQPFHAGTYYPPTPRSGLPSFRQLLTAVVQTWSERRAEVLSAGQQISAALAASRLPTGTQLPQSGDLKAAVHALAAGHDRRNGGFGGAPKFPPSPVLEFLLRHAVGAGETAPLAADLSARTLDAMARSGMYDQLGGGFARYAVDAAWVVPHFEKMLYDNAQLARVYLHHWRLTGSAQSARIAQETCDWMLRELRTPEGALASSLDADTVLTDEHGHQRSVEGFTYVWTPQQLTDLLGAAEAQWVAQLCAVTDNGTFEHGTSTLQLLRDPFVDDEQAQRWQRARRRLLQARAARPQPGRDDKVVTAWNGLAMAALAETGALLQRPDLVAAAEGIADLLLRVHLVDGRLRRVSRDGRVGRPAGVLEDYADLAEGLQALYMVTGQADRLRAAGGLVDSILQLFVADDGVHDTAADDTDAALAAVRRPSDLTDNAYPCGASAAAGALLTQAALTGRLDYRAGAEQLLHAAAPTLAQAPQAFGWWLAVAEAALAGPAQVAVVGVGAAGDELHRIALASPLPGRVVARAAQTDRAAGGVAFPALLADRDLLPGHDGTAYVCAGFVCDLPRADSAQVRERLAVRTR